MSWKEATLRILWLQRQAMAAPVGSKEREEWIRIKREIEDAARWFWTNEKTTAGTVAR